MLLSIIHGLNPNCKLKAVLEGCANLNHLWGSTLESHQLFSQDFFLHNCVYLRFTHITNFQPKFYMGQPFTMYLTESTVALGSTTNSRTIA